MYFRYYSFEIFHQLTRLVCVVQNASVYCSITGERHKHC